MSGVLQLLAAGGEAYVEPPGQIVFEFTKSDLGTPQNWVVPAGITQVSCLVVGLGGEPVNLPGSTIQGGGGGALTYSNNVSVTPGETLNAILLNAGGGQAGLCALRRSTTVLVSAESGFNGDSSYGTAGIGGRAAQGTGDVKYSGGNGGERTGGGGGGAAGYSGAGGTGSGAEDGTGGAGTGGAAGGGAGRDSSSLAAGSGGGVGLLGEGSSGAAQTTPGAGGNAGSSGENGGSASGANAADGGDYGGGGGGKASTGTLSLGGKAAVRIMWGPGRSYPSNAGDV